MIDPRRIDAHDAHQDAMARWQGYLDAETMNRDHDRLHAALAAWLGTTSHALRDANGEQLTRWERTLAAIEEDAVLHLQRWLAHAALEVPR